MPTARTGPQRSHTLRLGAERQSGAGRCPRRSWPWAGGGRGQQGALHKCPAKGHTSQCTCIPVTSVGWQQVLGDSVLSSGLQVSPPLWK